MTISAVAVYLRIVVPEQRMPLDYCAIAAAFLFDRRALWFVISAPLAFYSSISDPVMSENKICLRLLGLSLAPQPGVTQRYIAKKIAP